MKTFSHVNLYTKYETHYNELYVMVYIYYNGCYILHLKNKIYIKIDLVHLKRPKCRIV